MAVCCPGAEGRAEGLPCLVRPAPVSSANIVAAQPDFADPAVGKLGGGLRIDDGAPLTAGDSTARHVRHGAGRVGRDAHDLSPPQLVAVEVGDGRSFVG